MQAKSHLTVQPNKHNKCIKTPKGTKSSKGRVFYLSKKYPNGAAGSTKKCIQTPKGEKSSTRRITYRSKKSPKGAAGRVKTSKGAKSPHRCRIFLNTKSPKGVDRLIQARENTKEREITTHIQGIISFEGSHSSPSVKGGEGSVSTQFAKARLCQRLILHRLRLWVQASLLETK
jgi:hypothetical protein